MPRPGPRRPQIAVRVSKADRQRLDERAVEEDVERSELIRRLLQYAMDRMPRGWVG